MNLTFYVIVKVSNLMHGTLIRFSVYELNLLCNSKSLYFDAWNPYKLDVILTYSQEKWP